MSNTKLGHDCCGDRYECNTTKECKCGCGLFYCQSCYTEHMARQGEIAVLRAQEKRLQQDIHNLDKHMRSLVINLKARGKTVHDLQKLLACGSTVAQGVWEAYGEWK